MGVTGPSRCRSCAEPLDAGDNFCGRCGADLVVPAAAGYGAVPPPPSYAPTVGAPAAAPAGPPPPDPTTRIPDANLAAEGERATDGPAAGDPAQRPVDPRVAGYEVVADAAAGAARTAPAAAEDAPDEVPATVTDEPSADGTPDAPEEDQEAERATDTLHLCGVCHAGALTPDGFCDHCGRAQPRERNHMEHALAGVAAVSDRGHRHHRNEDFFALRATALPDGSPAVVAVVCDGVSSATRPDEASRAASEAAGEALLGSLPRGTHPQQAMHEAILSASAAVDALAADPSLAHDEHRQQNAPACTFVGAAIGGGLLTIGWVGDSRAYWIPNDRTAPPARLTEDDSWAAQMVANNLMSEAEANADERAHAITGWLGADAYEVEPHTVTFKPDGPGVVVVCTDGLWNYADSAAQMAAVLPVDSPARPLDAARTLVTHALDGGGHDNVTVAVVPFAVPSGS
ncbi:protein phosphatase 2C domain-containing protein [Streptomyces natalensis]|uniref:Protein phosphatase n=1 Tax=Streptomyces natalensis ATCC 27448 TaxID=1240678 RepID=A0A0D7CSQ7_9ACTN|nr:protein phosphatase 2C domain-containing protein [Streptomyces natalensis]KIZ18880.1 protein phosphatase [Streptomyces natalensis ATCC 27448]